MRRGSVVAIHPGEAIPLTTPIEMAMTAVLAIIVTALLVYRLIERVSRERGDSVADDESTAMPAVDRVVPEPTDIRMTTTDDSIDYLTDEDRVIMLLESNGGQLPQMTIVEETEWSKSKVSRLLSRMESNELLEKISVGRENLIALPDQAAIGEHTDE